ncbi:class I SAM-dependent methyltransferase [Gemmobacter sp.]|uniref:class I SAM-dependent methyltransferase n=1 Tax=Gemmobacter sp. TaxID=1898957 RepID=UPI002AFEDF47|nr:class I SAM-dependent methyltransferase [Gemmobacter sp.]
MNHSGDDVLQKAVMDRLEDFQASIRTYRRTTRRPPTFLRDGVAPRMRDDAFAKARVFPDRETMMLDVVAKGGIGAELGVQAGNFSRFLLDGLAPSRLYLFDLAADPIRQDVKADPRVSLHIGDSSSNLAARRETVFDWIYIDGDHSLTGARKDAQAALQRIRPGGLLIFNDYTPWSIAEAMPYGVIPVVNELVNEGLNFEAIALSPWGYFDVTLRAPG